MSSLDGIFTLQPEKLFEESILERINNLSDADALALLPAIGQILTEEVAAWADYCATVQSTSYATIISQLHAPGGADVDAIKAIFTHHVLETIPARFAILASKNRSEPRGPLPEIITVLRDQVQRYGTRGGAEFVRDARHRSAYGHHFAKAMSELEATMTGLENSRLEQLTRVHMLLLGQFRLKLTSTKHVVAFVAMVEEMGIDFGSITLE